MTYKSLNAGKTTKTIVITSVETLTNTTSWSPDNAEKTYTVSTEGNHQIILVGGGGKASFTNGGATSNVVYSSGGGSGACFHGVYNLKPGNYKVQVGYNQKTSGKSYYSTKLIDPAGTVVITAGVGSNGNYGSLAGGAGGTLTYSNTSYATFVEISDASAHGNGKRGSYSVLPAASGGGSKYGGYGKGQGVTNDATTAYAYGITYWGKASGGTNGWAQISGYTVTKTTQTKSNYESVLKLPYMENEGIDGYFATSTDNPGTGNGTLTVKVNDGNNTGSLIDNLYMYKWTGSSWESVYQNSIPTSGSVAITVPKNTILWYSAVPVDGYSYDTKRLGGIIIVQSNRTITLPVIAEPAE